jgi:catechol 2,3-dioxygenase-like lactoylglutathione lyase family enzyme
LTNIDPSDTIDVSGVHCLGHLGARVKTHLNLATKDINASVAFYRTLLLAEPTKNYSDYALFLTDQPGLELALDLDPHVNVVEGAHYGIVVETAEEVDAAIARFQSAGYSVDIEREATCCYAVQNKVWATDPDGRRWETYHVVADVEERDDVSACGTAGTDLGELVSGG